MNFLNWAHNALISIIKSLKLLNKLIIPAILTATVLIAGIFAFIPVEKAFTVHEDIIAAITGSQDAVLLDLENKTKLDFDNFVDFTNSIGDTGTVTIEAKDGIIPTTFNLKECYLTGNVDNFGQDDVQVVGITVDGEAIFTGTDGVFTSFGPWDDTTTSSGRATVEVISGLGFHTGLGADTDITMTIQVDDGDNLRELFCIAFVQNSADLFVTLTDIPASE